MFLHDLERRFRQHFKDDWLADIWNQNEPELKAPRVAGPNLILVEKRNSLPHAQAGAEAETPVYARESSLLKVPDWNYTVSNYRRAFRGCSLETRGIYRPQVHSYIYARLTATGRQGIVDEEESSGGCREQWGTMGLSWRKYMCISLC